MATKTGEVKYEGEGFEYVGSVYKNDNGEFVSWQLGEFWADGLVSEHCHRCVRHRLGSCVSGTHPRRQRGLPSYWCWWPPTPGVCGGDD